jgi:hypothetical protein
MLRLIGIRPSERRNLNVELVVCGTDMSPRLCVPEDFGEKMCRFLPVDREEQEAIQAQL